MKVLYITRQLGIGKGGCNVVIERNISLLKRIVGNVDIIEIPRPSKFTKLKNILFRESFGETRNIKKLIRERLRNGGYDFVFFDGSYYGTIVREAKTYGLKSICFYHNIEYVYYKEKSKFTRSVLDWIMTKFIHYNEALSTSYADDVITINDRDSLVMERIYNRVPTGILPTSFEYISRDNLIPTEYCTESYFLFVGGNFFANIEAVKYIVEKIAPYITKKILIIGDVCDSFVNLSIPPNIEFHGLVDDIAPYYKNAIGVIAPIFSGSGLKTKSIEALRYGKTIIGSEEAFKGIPLEKYPDIGVLCTSDNSYIDAINNFNGEYINLTSLSVFKKYYSHEAQLANLKCIMSQYIGDNRII